MIYRKSNSETIGTHPSLRPSILLHQSNDYGTFVIVVIRMIQRNTILRIVAEGLCEMCFLFNWNVSTKFNRFDMYLHISPKKFLQPPAVTPRTHSPSNTLISQRFFPALRSSVVKESGFKLHISS